MHLGTSGSLWESSGIHLLPDPHQVTKGRSQVRSDPHQVRSLLAKIGWRTAPAQLRGSPCGINFWRSGELGKTVRTPTAKAVWGMDLLDFGYIFCLLCMGAGGPGIA